MSFLQASLDLFTGARVGHMVGEHYVGHAGMRDGRSMSGPQLWAEAERVREAQGGAGQSNLVSAEQKLLQQVAVDLPHYLPSQPHIIELGPGTVGAFTKKTLPVIHALQATDITLVDGSAAFLRDIAACPAAEGLTIKPVEDDFFEGRQLYHDGNAPDLICTFGSTISNIVAPRSDELPENALMAGLASFAQAVNEGWMLIGFDSSQDGERLKVYYENAQLFFVSIFDRMAIELPIRGNFDPKAFDYQADWNLRSGQIAHMAVVNRDLQFNLGGRNLFLYQGQKFHMKNAYKYRPAFFENCCERIGLAVVKSWSDESAARIYLLKKLPQLIAKEPPMPKSAAQF